MNNKIFAKTVIILLFALSSIISSAQESYQKLNFYGDVGLRFAREWNYVKNDGYNVVDRSRLLYQLHFGFNYDWNENVQFGGRLTTGNRLNQQTAYVAFGNEFQPTAINLDKVFIKYKKDNYWVWAGKNSFPFFKQNEMFWDDDINPEGVAAGIDLKLNDKIFKINATAGYFVPNNSAELNDYQARLYAFQMNLMNTIKAFDVTLSSGMFAFMDLPDTPDNTNYFLLNYRIWNSGIQVKSTKLPLTVGFDYYKNLENYQDFILINSEYRNQTTGYVVNLNYGNSSKKGDIALGYLYASIGKYAVVDYFAQDNWTRFGNSNYTRTSNIKGSEFSIKYTFDKDLNVLLRGFIASGIKTTGASLESGNRITLDINIKF